MLRKPTLKRSQSVNLPSIEDCIGRLELKKDIHFIDKYSPLCNWYKCTFEENDITFSSVEQYMMYHKAILFKDLESAEEIINTDDQKMMRSLGRQVNNFDIKLWEEKRYDIVYDGTMCKFGQNNVLRRQLIDTGDTIIAKTNQHDQIWGIGISGTNANRYDKSKWSGLNLLGKCLMKVRNDLSAP